MFRKVCILSLLFSLASFANAHIGKVAVQNLASLKCVSVGAVASTQQLQQAECASKSGPKNPMQQWRLVEGAGQDSDAFYILSEGTAQCLQASPSGAVLLAACDVNKRNQRFILMSLEETPLSGQAKRKVYRIMATSTLQCVSLKTAGGIDATQSLVTQPCDNGLSQKFVLHRVGAKKHHKNRGDTSTSSSSGDTSSSSGDTSSGSASSGWIPPAGGQKDQKISGVYITWYGFDDNSCETEEQHTCDNIAFPKKDGWKVPHDTTMEDLGTYNRPITLAAAALGNGKGGPWPVGTLFYIPMVHKYFVMEDSCFECRQDWKKHKYHVDLYMGLNKVGGSNLIHCEEALTTTSTIIVNPSPGYPVETQKIYMPGNCTSKHNFSTDVKPAPSGSSSGTSSSGSSGASGNPSETDPKPLRTIKVTSIADLQAKINEAIPGDEIVLANGVYTTSGFINVNNKHGTASNPIVIRAETVGGVEIKGSSGFSINGSSYSVIKGFKFTHATSGSSSIRPGATHNRFTRNIFELTGEGVYLTVSGDDSEIDHNEFRNKHTLGNMLAVQGPGSPSSPGMAQRTWVHHNYFHDFKAPGGNGAETVRVGLSWRSMVDAYSLFEYNLFERTDGENETVSNKSGSNVYRYNTFRDTVGELTLRHGNKCLVYGNFFISSHGIRFFGDDHKIYSNYFERCDPAVQIGNGDTQLPNGPLTGHDRPDRVRFSFNTLINNKQNAMMPGRSGGMGATDLVFSNNIIQSDLGSALLVESITNAKYEGNIVWGKTANGNMPANGARRIDPQLVQDASGVFRLKSTSPAINASVGSYPEVTVDMDGQARASGKDVGADQFSTEPVKGLSGHPLSSSEVGPNAP